MEINFAAILDAGTAGTSVANIPELPKILRGSVTTVPDAQIHHIVPLGSVNSSFVLNFMHNFGLIDVNGDLNLTPLPTNVREEDIGKNVGAQHRPYDPANPDSGFDPHQSYNSAVSKGFCRKLWHTTDWLLLLDAAIQRVLRTVEMQIGRRSRIAAYGSCARLRYLPGSQRLS